MSRSASIFLLLAFSLTPLTAQRRHAAETPWIPGAPRVSLEIPASDPAYGADRIDARYPRIAAGPNQALAAWSSGVVRIGADGQPLDPIPLLRFDGYTAPDVAWDGSRYQVAFGAYQSVQIGTVDPEGHVTPPQDVEKVPYGVPSVAIAASGGNTLVAYSAGRFDPASNSIRGVLFKALILSGGRVMNRFDLGSDLSIAYQGMPLRAVASPSGFLVWWRPSRDTLYKVVNLDGSVVASGTIAGKAIDAAWNGAAWEVVATDDSISASSGVTLFPLAPSGAIGAVSTIQVAPAVKPAIAWNGAQYALLWKDVHQQAQPGGVYVTATFDLKAVSVSPSQEVVGSTVLVPSIDFTDYRWLPGPGDVAMAAVGSHFIPLWCEGPVMAGSSLRQLYATSFVPPQLPTAASVAATKALISRTSVGQGVAGIRTAGDSAALFFFDPTLRYETIDREGREGSPVLLTLPVRYTTPLVVSNGLDTLLTWRGDSTGDSWTWSGGIVDQRGSVVRQFTIATLASSMWPGPATCDDADCAVVWYHSRTYGGLVDDAYFQRISSAGTLINSPLQLPPGFLAMSGRGNQYLIIERWGYLDTDNRTIATRFAEGKLSDVTDVIDVPVGMSGHASAVAGPDGWLVALTEYRGQSSSVDVHLVQLDELARPMWRLDLSNMTIDPPTMTWDGRNWLIVWPSAGDLRAARVSASGVLLDGTKDSPGVRIGAVEGPVYVASPGNGLTAVAYSRRTNDDTYGVSHRSFVRWVEEP